MLRHEILVFVGAREGVGVSKTELFARFKDVSASEILQELDHLVMLEFLAEDAHGGKAFVQTSAMPAAARFRITPGGRKVVDKPSMDEMVVEEPS